ncbi:MAG TPA: glycosyltransferase family 4 protein [Conexibacter sp.]|nr:glycosyltransferase family 4 protein [Conexibacter sp.]
MRVASLIIEGQVNSIYRSLIPMEALAQRGHQVHVEERNAVPDPRRFLDFDVIHMWRCYHEPMLRLARLLRAEGVPIVWDNDDDLTSIPKNNVGYKRVGGLSGQRQLADMTRMMRMASIVTAPSEALADRFRERSGADVRVIENYLPDRFVPPLRRLPRRGVSIGWLAALEHRHDYELLRLRETFQALLERRPEVVLTTVGLNLAFDHPRYRHITITPYGELPALLSQFDLALAPLADIPFNRSRSNVKLKEYAAMGVPWLASPIGPYAGMGADEGGMLVPDDGWLEALDRLVTDGALRRRLAQAAGTWSQRETIAHHVEEWESVLQDAITQTQTAGPA